MLMAIPGPPVFDEERREQIKALMAKGAAGGLSGNQMRMIQ